MQGIREPESLGASQRSSFESLKLEVEALLFTAEAPLEASEIRAVLGAVALSDVRTALRALARDYEPRAFELVEIDLKYQIRTKSAYVDLVKTQRTSKPRQLGKNALETLSIVAYRQPVTKAQINALRQLDSSSLIQNLKEKELIYASGTRKEIGNPIEYRTTQKFLEIFGLKSLNDLPNLRSLQPNLDEQKTMKDVLEAIDAGTTCM